MRKKGRRKKKDETNKWNIMYIIFKQEEKKLNKKNTKN